MRKLLLFFCICCILSNTNSHTVKIWSRIPKYFVHERVYNFLGDNGISDCYEFLETPQTLLLKCWRDNSLTDVTINIESKVNRKYYTSIASI